MLHRIQSEIFFICLINETVGTGCTFFHRDTRVFLLNIVLAMKFHSPPSDYRFAVDLYFTFIPDVHIAFD